MQRMYDRCQRVQVNGKFVADGTGDLSNLGSNPVTAYPLTKVRYWPASQDRGDWVGEQLNLPQYVSCHRIRPIVAVQHDIVRSSVCAKADTR
jgi:hypothetical protein